MGANKTQLKNHIFETEEFLSVETITEQKETVLRTFKEYLESHSKVLMKKFKKHDPEGTGKFRFSDYMCISKKSN